MDMPSVDSIYEIQTASTLVIIPLQDENESECVGIYEFLHKSFARCPINVLYWLSYFKKAKSLSKAFVDHADLDKDTLRSEIRTLMDVKFLVSSSAGIDNKTSQYAQTWEWDLTTALFHFTVTDNAFMSDQEAKERQCLRLQNDPPPPYWWQPKYSQNIDISEHINAKPSHLLDIIKRRRTNRTSIHQSVDLSTIASCLHAGLGIVGTIKATSGNVPLSMTPSGGARNPYEAFVIVRRGADIASGIYHFCAADQLLEKVDGFDPSTKLTDHFGGQEWVDEMSVVIVLVAVFERMMWKYQDPNAYRVLLMQAGHIGQNIMLKATEDGYTVCPTAAMSHSRVSELLQLQDNILHVPIYALTLDKACSSEEAITPIVRSTHQPLDEQLQAPRPRL